MESKDDDHTCLVGKLFYHSLLSIKATENPPATVKVHNNRQSFIAVTLRANYSDRYLFGIRPTRVGTVFNVSQKFLDSITSLKSR